MLAVNSESFPLAVGCTVVIKNTLYLVQLYNKNSQSQGIKEFIIERESQRVSSSPSCLQQAQKWNGSLPAVRKTHHALCQDDVQIFG
jgi:hypothetical protein